MPKIIVIGFCILLLYVPYSHSVHASLPVFHDELLGELIVSTKKFPFLTSKQDPDLAHIFPTDDQMKQIKEAVGGQANFNNLRAKRQSG